MQEIARGEWSMIGLQWDLHRLNNLNLSSKQITYVEQPLKDPTRALGTYGVKDGDVVVLRQADRRPPQTQPAFPGNVSVDISFDQQSCLLAFRA